MRILKGAFFFSVVTICCWLTVIFYNKWTDGFSVRQMLSDLPYNILFEVQPLTETEQQQVYRILDQPFHYLGKGCQFYAFESADGQYVLKFLKQKHLRLWKELNQIPLPSFLRSIIDKKIAIREQRVANLFSSCKLAYEELPEQSGLIFIHLNRTPFYHKKISLIDPLGWKHDLALDKFEFILQRRAIPLTDLVQSLAKKEDFIEQMSQHLIQLEDLIITRCIKGIKDKDRSFVKNVAIGSVGALFIDVGQFYKDPSSMDGQEQLEELSRRFHNLQAWIEERFPDHAEPFKALIDQHLTSFAQRA